MSKNIKYSATQIDSLIEGIYSGKITVESLPEDLYLAIADVLNHGVKKGLTNFGYGAVSDELKRELTENIYIFSGGKTFQQVKEMQKYLLNDEGNIIPFGEFKKIATGIFDKYNKDWLEAEYVTSVGQAETAAKWKDIEKNKAIFPFLKYSAVMDSHTSMVCEKLNGKVAKVEDSFWDKNSPLQHYRCRCVLEQLKEA